MKRNASYYYAALHFFYWMTNSAVYSFSSTFLLHNGFRSSEIGLIMGLGSIGSLLIEPVLADWADHSRYSLQKIMMVICGLFLLAAGGLLILEGHSIALFVFYVLVYILHTVIQPVMNELNYRMERAGEKMNFGIARAMGSLGYSIMSAVMGIMVERYGVKVIPGITIAVIVILIVLLKLLDQYSPGKKEHSAEAETGSAGFFEFARRNRRLVLLSVGGAFLMYSSHACGSYLLQIMRNVGGDAKDMGFGLSLAAITELPAMILFSQLADRFGSGRLLRFSCAGYLIKQLTLLLARDITMVYVSQAFQMLSFALFLPAIVAYAHEHTPEADAVKGQALMPATSAMAGLLASISGGVLIDGFGVRSFLLVCLLTAVIGTVMIFRYSEVKRL